jgi:hypothetical protein
MQLLHLKVEESLIPTYYTLSSLSWPRFLQNQIESDMRGSCPSIIGGSNSTLADGTEEKYGYNLRGLSIEFHVEIRSVYTV